MLHGIIFMFLFLFITNIRCEEGKSKDEPENNRVLGIKTVVDGKIVKKTQITYRKREKRDAESDATSSPENTNVHTQQFRTNMSECVQEVQSKEGKGPEENEELGCVIACLLKRNGIFENGKVHKENLLTLLNNFYTEEVDLMKKMEEQVDQCLGSSADEDDCALAESLNDCVNNLLDYNKHMLTANQ